MPDFPSGEWVGFYTYGGRSMRYLMDLVLTFEKGIMTSDGADGIGEFYIGGSYREFEDDCEWIKTYVGKHSVEYRGFREGKGIWGTWRVKSTTGGFHIWPIGQNSESLVDVKEEVFSPSLVEASADFGCILSALTPNQSLEPMARSVTSRAAHEPRQLSPWLTIKR